MRTPTFLLATGLATLLELPAQRFVDETFVAGFALPVGFVAHDHHRFYVYERSGLIKVVDHGVRLQQPLLDIREEVGNWRDFGLLGMALDPDFDNNGFFYVAYIVDYHHLMHFGTPAYDPQADEYFTATVVRVTRFTADATNDFKTTVPGSRHVLLGESPSTGVPSTYFSHGACSILFGRDGTLLVATGEGAGFVGRDIGSDPTTMFQQALADGILRPQENVGVFRAQMIDSLAGKVLRLDPATGDGVPSNPFYDPQNPRAPRSRVYALGLRNPCRMTIKPGTGSTNPADAQPGELWVGDVGASQIEEVSSVTGPGQNLGWPLFEGLAPNAGFTSDLVHNQYAPNPLFGGTCVQQYFRFQDLLKQASTNPPQFPNPCNPSIGIAANTPTFVHRLPVLDWSHNVDVARVAVFTGTDPTFPIVGEVGSGVEGVPFKGNASIAGCWHSGQSFPPTHGASYYHADYGGNWIKRLVFDNAGALIKVEHFADVDAPLMLAEHPEDHSLLYVSYRTNEIRRIRWVIEPPPVPVIAADVTWGSSPLRVQLDARGSYDPEGQPITIAWDLGLGQTSTAPQLGVTLPGNGQPAVHQVALTVTDSMGAQTTKVLPIHVDNTPPRVEITSVRNGDLYSLTTPTTIPLQADVSDAESPNSALTYAWRTTLIHNNHEHPEPADNQPATTALLTPTPHDHEFYCYRIELTVTDPTGLETTRRVFLYPDTTGSNSTVLLTSPQHGDVFPEGQPVQFTAIKSGNVTQVEYYVDGRLIGSSAYPPHTVTWTPTGAGPFTAIALAVTADDSSSDSRAAVFGVEVPNLLQARVADSSDDAQEERGQPTPTTLAATELVLGDDGNPQLTGVRFADLPLPVQARIRTAWIDFTAAAANHDLGVLEIDCERAADALGFAAEPHNLADRNTTSPLTWATTPWLPGQSGTPQRTPDLTALVQTVVAQPKWTGDLVALFRGSSERRARSFDGDAATAPLLTVRWLPPAPSAVTMAITTGNDDATEVLATGQIDRANPALRLGDELGVPRLVGLRFPIPVPPGARLESARLQFTSNAGQTGQARFTVRAQASDDAPAITGNLAQLSSRATGTAVVDWTPIGWAASGAAPLSVDLKDVLQPLLQRPGWQQGNRALLLIRGTGTRTARSYNASAKDAPRLLLTWRMP